MADNKPTPWEIPEGNWDDKRGLVSPCPLELYPVMKEHFRGEVHSPDYACRALRHLASAYNSSEKGLPFNVLNKWHEMQRDLHVACYRAGFFNSGG